MLGNILLLILSAISSFFTILLLARVFMQWQRISFHNQIGQFVTATTNWLVMPLRRVIPGLMGVDLASVVAAWMVQALMVGVEFSVRGAGLGAELLIAMLGVGFFEMLKMVVYLLIAIVLFSVILSWVNPHAPIAPTVHSLSDPFLRPIRRVVPPIANIDLSPLVFLLLLQVVLMLLGSVQASTLPLLLR